MNTSFGVLYPYYIHIVPMSSIVWYQYLNQCSCILDPRTEEKQRRGNMKENFPSPSKTDTSHLMPFFFGTRDFALIAV